MSGRALMLFPCSGIIIIILTDNGMNTLISCFCIRILTNVIIWIWITLIRRKILNFNFTQQYTCEGLSNRCCIYGLASRVTSAASPAGAGRKLAARPDSFLVSLHFCLKLFLQLVLPSSKKLFTFFFSAFQQAGILKENYEVIFI